MLIAVLAGIPPTLAALAAWRVAGRPTPNVERIEAMVHDILDWQITHDRMHRGKGGQQ